MEKSQRVCCYTFSLLLDISRLEICYLNELQKVNSVMDENQRNLQLVQNREGAKLI